MVASFTGPADLGTDQDRVIASLAAKLHRPLSEVRQVYVREFDRLRSEARIHTFIEVLAVRSTRSALRAGRKPRTSGSSA